MYIIAFDNKEARVVCPLLPHLGNDLLSETLSIVSTSSIEN